MLVGKTQMQVRGCCRNVYFACIQLLQSAAKGSAVCSLGAMLNAAHSRPASLCALKTHKPTQEFGLLPTGLSAKLGFARNPHNLDCIPGGSR